ncbi:MAG: tetratricopeptide repeat protein [bacterium]
MKKVCIFFTAVVLLGSILFTNCQQPAVTSAKMQIEQKNWDAAIEQGKLAIERMPNDTEAYFVLGQAYAGKKMYREMNEAYTKCLEISPAHSAEIEQDRLKHWINLFNSGTALLRQGQFSEAIPNYLIAAELIPDKKETYQNLAYAYGQTGNDSAAIDVYRKAIEIAPADLEIKNSLGLLLYHGKQYDEAIRVLSEVIEKATPQDKIYNDALYNLAYSYDLKGDSKKAIETYESALKTSPNDKDLIFNMGRLYFIQENYAKAIESFKKIIAIDPEDFETNYNIGLGYIAIADSLSAEAKNTDERGNFILPEKERNQREQQSKTNFELSIPYLEKATQIQPDNANPWMYLGKAYIRVGMLEKGQAAFEKADSLKGQE